ncbi:MAG: hypothetical protein QM736_24335 [Vicinamibacterales bacterium]
MIGYTGHLIAAAFLRARADDAVRAAAGVALQQPLRRWCSGAQSLGPASSFRALLDVAVHPLLALLGLRDSRRTTIHARCRAPLCTAGADRVVVVVAPWGNPLGGFWRTAVGEASRVAAEWCLLFNGTHLRLIDATRLHSHRFAEFDLEAAADDRVTAAALAMVCAAGALENGGRNSRDIGCRRRARCLRRVRDAARRRARRLD